MDLKIVQKYGLTIDELNKKNVIYKLCFNTDCGEKYYIGMTTRKLDRRIKDHISKSLKNNNIPVYNAINKYGVSNLKIEILDESENLECLKKKEIFWISYYKSYIYLENSRGYNCTLGGDGVFGFKKSEESKLKEVWTKKQRESFMTAEQAYEIKKLLCEGYKIFEISKITKQPREKIGHISHLRSWKYLATELNDTIIQNRYVVPDVLDDEIVAEIKVKLSEGVSNYHIAKEYNITSNLVTKIKRLESHVKVREDLNEIIIKFLKEHNSPITEDLAILIKTNLSEGGSIKNITQKYNISKHIVWNISKFRTHANICPELNDKILNNNNNKKVKENLDESMVIKIKLLLMKQVGYRDICEELKLDYDSNFKRISQIKYLNSYKNYGSEYNDELRRLYGKQATPDLHG